MVDFINHSFTQKFYYFITVLMWLMYIIALTGVITFNPAYINMLDNVAKLYVAVFLIIRFNPFIKNVEMTKFDKDVVLSAGVFLLLSSTITIAARTYFENKIKLIN